MRTLIAGTILLLLTCFAGYAHASIPPFHPHHSIISNTTPPWVQRANIGKTCWYDGLYFYAVGTTAGMQSKQEQKDISIYLAHANIAIAIGVRSITFERSEIIDRWTDTDDTLYILIRVLPHHITIEE